MSLMRKNVAAKAAKGAAKPAAGAAAKKFASAPVRGKLAKAAERMLSAKRS